MKSKKITLTQQAACFFGESGIEKVSFQRESRVRRRQQMAILYPQLGTQVLQVDPDGDGIVFQHGGEIPFGQFAPERFYYNVSGRTHVTLSGPVPNLDGTKHLLRFMGLNRGVHPRECLQVIDPQADGKTMFVAQLSCQTPTDANVSKVVDDGTKNIPGFHGAEVAFNPPLRWIFRKRSLIGK